MCFASGELECRRVSPTGARSHEAMDRGVKFLRATTMSQAEKLDADKVEEQPTSATVGAVHDLNESSTVIGEHVPDGGRAAWTVVLGSTLALFASAGMINAYVCFVPRCFHNLLTSFLIPSHCRGRSKTITNRLYCPHPPLQRFHLLDRFRFSSCTQPVRSPGESLTPMELLYVYVDCFIVLC